MKNIITILLLLINSMAFGQMTLVVDRFHIYPTATFVPKTFDAAKTYDLLISFHGKDENGGGTSNLSRLYGQGLAKILKEGYQPSKDVIICNPQDNWGGIDAQNMPAIIAGIKAKYKVGNIYLTGASAGGAGVGGSLFGISEAFLKTIAGAVVISPGWIDTKNAAWAKNSTTKYWFMAGTQSADVSQGYTANATNIHNAINTQAPGKSKLTVKAGIGHGGSFTTPYQDTAFWNFIGGTATAPPPVVIPPVVTTTTGITYTQMLKSFDSLFKLRATPVQLPNRVRNDSLTTDKATETQDGYMSKELVNKLLSLEVQTALNRDGLQRLSNNVDINGVKQRAQLEILIEALQALKNLQ